MGIGRDDRSREAEYGRFVYLFLKVLCEFGVVPGGGYTAETGTEFTRFLFFEMAFWVRCKLRSAISSGLNAQGFLPPRPASSAGQLQTTLPDLLHLQALDPSGGHVQ